MKNIILASTSPRRKDLMSYTGVPFTVVASPYEEDMSKHTDPHTLVMEFSQGKVHAVSQNYPNSIIIGADTVVAVDDKVFGKPKDKTEGIEMLTQLQGRSHFVYTGFTVLDTANGKEKTQVVESKLEFTPLTKQEIESYLSKVDFLDKAGSYAIMDLGNVFTKRIEGEYSAVVGLPMASLRLVLKEFGVELL